MSTSLLPLKVFNYYIYFLFYIANVPYYIYVGNTAAAYIEYTIQIGYNCTLTLEQCYPYRVDATTCKCSENKTVQPLLTTAGDMVQVLKIDTFPRIN